MASRAVVAYNVNKFLSGFFFYYLLGLKKPCIRFSPEARLQIFLVLFFCSFWLFLSFDARSGMNNSYKRCSQKSAKCVSLKIRGLFKLANKILSLYFLVLALWFYLVLYVFNCPKSIGCTEWCYQIVITSLLSINSFIIFHIPSMLI